ncbi:MAG: Xaa-Pro peptidase family protein [Mariprofundaceae bacterium]|nr:Xaa-Pro peptidase family protein [Mariprofundaceae bacterium]
MTTTQLIISDSEHDADMLYISRMFVPDAFIAIGIENQAGRKWHGLLSPLEVDRAKKESSFDAVHLDSIWRDKAKKIGWDSGLASIAAAFLKECDITELEVPGHFPLMYADQLRSWGFALTAKQGSLFPQRAIKSDVEIKQLARAERLTKESMIQAENFLAICSIGNDKILRHPDDNKTKVKSKHVRAVIETFLIAQGAMPAHTIVACGKEGADPHNTGSGFIYAHKSIIIDIFPRLLDSGYWGDMTRSYVKGKAPNTLKKMYQTVCEGQDIGLNKIAAGIHGAEIHQAILDHFDQKGFKTGIKDGQQTGFFHGTGHGVGLQIHELPRISSRDDILQEKQVVTVEPGLYYPELGGIRLEDMVVVHKTSCENLTQHPRNFEIL